jgi:beta-glucanase (GH16 family)
MNRPGILISDRTGKIPKMMIMKPFYYSFLLCLVGLALGSCKPKKSGELILPSDTTRKYKLIWSEEFDYTGLPDSTKWSYENGYLRNNEKQYYTSKRSENARVENGMLVIESRKENWKGFAYTSASINTLGKDSFPVNSRIEIRAKLPRGKGIWPALWMMGTDINAVDWPACGEIDIMEYLGRTPGVIYGTFHWQDASRPDSSLHRQRGDSTRINDATENFHVYGVERTPEKMTFFVDNNYFFEFPADSTVKKDLFNHPYYLLINTAVGGDWGGDINTTIFPQKYYIDWVRVFSMNGNR